MGDLLIRDVSEAMKRSIAARAEKNGTSLSDEAKSLLQKAMMDLPVTEPPTRSAWEGMREVFSPLTDDEREDFVNVMKDIESERKKDFGRQVEDFD